VKIAVGKVSATFAVTSKKVSVKDVVTLKGTLAGVSKTAVLTVTP